MKAIVAILVGSALLVSCTAKTPTQTEVVDTPTAPVTVEVETTEETSVEVETVDMTPEVEMTEEVPMVEDTVAM